ncbi:MAG: HDIG domain-containing metalloprotein [Candidatus Berkelbacteria bacterium]
MNRDEAYKLLIEYTTKPGLIKHALAVEMAMRAHAEKFGEDVESWGIVGLLHDFDYEKYPTSEGHPYEGAKILKDKVPEEWITAILGHGTYTGVARETKMAKTLFAVDELTGLITAAALIRPDKKLAEVEISSIKKKMKNISFAAAVSREDIIEGAKDLGIELDDHIGIVLEAMKNGAKILGL